MKRYLFTDSSIKELAHISKFLYETFMKANKTLVDSPDSVSSDQSLDIVFTPHEYYRLRFESREVYIHKYRGKNKYSLCCVGFAPSGFKQQFANSEFEYYRQLYGFFDSISDAVSAFRSACYQCMGVD